MIYKNCCSFLYRVGVISKKFEDIVDQKEKWYGTDYRLDDIPDEKVQVGSTSCYTEHVQSNQIAPLTKKNQFFFMFVEMERLWTV